VLSLAGAGAELTDALNRREQGDYGRAIISGLGALGSAAAMIPHPATRAIGTGVALAAPVINMGIDAILGRDYAQGGSVQGYSEGNSVGPYVGYPQISNKPRDPNFVQQSGPVLGGLDAMLGMGKRGDVSVMTPQGQAYNSAYEKFEPAGIAASVLPFIGGPTKALGKSAARTLGPKAADMAEDYLTKIGGLQNIVPQSKRSLSSSTIGDAFDPRFDPRKLEQDKLKNLTRHTERYQTVDAPTMSLTDIEGKPFVTQMADRSDAGSYLQGINDVNFKRDVDLQGGQRYMFNNPGKVWTSTPGPSKQTMKEANMLKEFTGQDPYLIPWRMGPQGSDFAHMTGETMLAYAESAMGRTEKKMLDQAIKNYIPNWRGIDNPASMTQFKSAPSGVRKNIQFMIDKDFRDKGGLGIGEARLAIAEPSQVNAVWGGIQNIGKIHAGQPLIEKTGHWSYPGGGVPGVGVGTLNAADQQRNIYELLPKAVRERGIKDPKNPSADDLRALQMKPYTGIMTADILKQLGYATGGGVKGYQAGRIVKAASDLILPAAENAARTQIIGTLPTYGKAAEMLAQRGASGQAIDFGAGLGKGADLLGPGTHTYEPFAKNWTPTFSNAADVPSDAYGRLTNLNVLNVVPREARDEIVQNIGRVMQPGGQGILTTRGADVMKAQGRPGPEPTSIITSRDTYQKGFTKQELEDYMRYMLGNKFDVNKVNLGPAGVHIQKKAEGGEVAAEPTQTDIMSQLFASAKENGYFL
jgi:hypothetical protein